MEELNNQQLDILLQTAPGGAAKIAFDEMLTILYATDNFFHLIKSGSDNTTAKIPASLLRMVFSADIIYLTQQIATQRHRKDNMISLNFRTLQQDGSFRWVMITGSKTEETYQSGAKQTPVYSCLAVDVTSLMVNYKKLEQTVEYHRVISELSKELFYEYEIATDTLTFTETFREIFGKENVMTGFRKRLEKTKTIHAEELPAIISIYNSMMSGRKQARFELRLIPKDQVPCWYICYASIIFDENRTPYKVVGKLSMMNVAAKESEKAEPERKLDTVTGVYTKETAEELISAAVEKDGDALGALLILDIRNYKSINEIRKSIGNENILAAIGRVLKENLRTSDIIGRTGFCEFIVYVKDIASDQMIYELADRLCRELEQLHSYKHLKNGLSVSIGITLHRGTSSYAALSANANTALVMAKKIPDSSFEVFGGTTA